MQSLNASRKNRIFFTKANKGEWIWETEKMISGEIEIFERGQSKFLTELMTWSGRYSLKDKNGKSKREREKSSRWKEESERVSTRKELQKFKGNKKAEREREWKARPDGREKAPCEERKTEKRTDVAWTWKRKQLRGNWSLDIGIE